MNGASRRTDILTLALLPVWIALLYLPGLHAAPFCDDALVLASAREGFPVADRFLDPAPPSGRGEPGPTYAWRPMTEASFALNRLATGNALWGFRLANQLLHFLSALLVFRLARRLSGALGQPPAFARWAALLFAVHPLAVHAVTYIYQRSVALDTLFSLACLNAYLDARERNRGILSLPYALAWLSALLAVASKEPAVTLPLSLAALEWILPGPHGRLRRLAPFLLPPAVAALQVARAALAHPVPVLPGMPLESGFRPGIFGFSRLQYLLVELPVLVRYASLSVLPFPLRFYWDRTYPLPDAPWSPGWAALPCGLLLLAAGAWILLGPGRHRLPRLALALFLAPLALESSVFPIRDPAFDHRCVPGLAGAACLLAGACARVRPGLALAAAALFAQGTLGENRLWAEPAGPLRRDVRQAFHYAVTWQGLARLDLEAGRPGAALRLLARGSRLPWIHHALIADCARALRETGQAAEAGALVTRFLGHFPDSEDLLQEALRLDPGNLQARRALEALRDGRSDAAD